MKKLIEQYEEDSNSNNNYHYFLSFLLKSFNINSENFQEILNQQDNDIYRIFSIINQKNKLIKFYNKYNEVKFIEQNFKISYDWIKKIYNDIYIKDSIEILKENSQYMNGKYQELNLDLESKCQEKKINNEENFNQLESHQRLPQLYKLKDKGELKEKLFIISSLLRFSLFVNKKLSIDGLNSLLTLLFNYFDKDIIEDILPNGIDSLDQILNQNKHRNVIESDKEDINNNDLSDRYKNKNFKLLKLINNNNNLSDEIKELFNELIKNEFNLFLDELKQLQPIYYNKNNFLLRHVHFLLYSSNLRAALYSLPSSSLLQVQKVSGNIIPALVTTTSLITGYVGLELEKILSERIATKKIFEYSKKESNEEDQIDKIKYKNKNLKRKIKKFIVSLLKNKYYNKLIDFNKIFNYYNFIDPISNQSLSISPYTDLKKKLLLNRFQNTFISLTQPSFFYSSPMETLVDSSKGYSIWDEIIIKNSNTKINSLQELILLLESKFKIQVLSISLIYNENNKQNSVELFNYYEENDENILDDSFFNVLNLYNLSKNEFITKYKKNIGYFVDDTEIYNEDIDEEFDENMDQNEEYNLYELKFNIIAESKNNQDEEPFQLPQITLYLKKKQEKSFLNSIINSIF